jgi:hypothetical protein
MNTWGEDSIISNIEQTTNAMRIDPIFADLFSLYFWASPIKKTKK